MHKKSILFVSIIAILLISCSLTNKIQIGSTQNINQEPGSEETTQPMTIDSEDNTSPTQDPSGVLSTPVATIVNPEDLPFGDSFETVSEIVMNSDQDGWLMTEGNAILHWNGSYWHRLRGDKSDHDIWTMSGDIAWVASNYYLWRWNQETDSWQKMNSSSIFGPDDIFTAIFGTSEEDIWISGYSYIAHYDGQKWEKVKVTLETREEQLSGIKIIDGTGPNDVWFVTDESVKYHWDGEKIYIHEGAGGSGIDGIEFLSENSGWAVGDGFFYWDGMSWELFQPGEMIKDVSMINESSGWAIGYTGIVYRWDGNSWEVFTYLQDSEGNIVDRMLAIDMVSETDGWIGGSCSTVFGGGILYRWTGSEWIIFLETSSD